MLGTFLENRPRKGRQRRCSCYSQSKAGISRGGEWSASNYKISSNILADHNANRTHLIFIFLPLNISWKKTVSENIYKVLTIMSPMLMKRGESKGWYKISMSNAH